MKHLVMIFALVFSHTAFSHEMNDRITKLEEEVSNLKAVVGLMMLANANKSEEKADAFEPQGEGWRDIRNWRKLSKGMPPAQVTSLLGEPKSVNSGPFTYWNYQSRGKVEFTKVLSTAGTSRGSNEISFTRIRRYHSVGRLFLQRLR